MLTLFEELDGAFSIVDGSLAVSIEGTLSFVGAVTVFDVDVAVIVVVVVVVVGAIGVVVVEAVAVSLC